VTPRQHRPEGLNLKTTRCSDNKKKRKSAPQATTNRFAAPASSSAWDIHAAPDIGSDGVGITEYWTR
jgi:hypothetical protein